jgi:hypothetical protein
MVLFAILLLFAFALLGVALHITVFIVQAALFGLVVVVALCAVLAALSHLTNRH